MHGVLQHSIGASQPNHQDVVYRRLRCASGELKSRPSVPVAGRGNDHRDRRKGFTAVPSCTLRKRVFTLAIRRRTPERCDRTRKKVENIQVNGCAADRRAGRGVCHSSGNSQNGHGFRPRRIAARRGEQHSTREGGTYFQLEEVYSTASKSSQLEVDVFAQPIGLARSYHTPNDVVTCAVMPPASAPQRRARLHRTSPEIPFIPRRYVISPDLRRCRRLNGILAVGHAEYQRLCEVDCLDRHDL